MKMDKKTKIKMVKEHIEELKQYVEDFGYIYKDSMSSLKECLEYFKTNPR